MHDAIVLFSIIFVALIFFIWGYWRYDVVALLALITSMLFGLVPYREAFSGFSNPAVVTVACVMILTETVSLSGFTDFVVKRLSILPNKPIFHTAGLVLLVAIFSAFINNVGALTLMMPIAIQTAIKYKRSPSTILMPLAFGSALGGLTTAIGTPPNILIATYRQQATGQPFTMFDFTPVGLSIAVLGLLFIILIGWRLLPQRQKTAKNTEELFKIQDYIAEIKIPKQSPVVGKTVIQLEQLIEGDFTILGLVRNKQKRLLVRLNEILEADDILIVEASHTDLAQLVKEAKLELGDRNSVTQELLSSQDTRLLEAVVPPASRLEGRSAKTLHLRSRYNLNLLAIAREGRSIVKRLYEAPFMAGDVLLLQGESENIQETAVSLGFLPLVERTLQVGMPRLGILSMIIFVAAIAVAALQLLPIQISFLIAVVTMILFKVLPVRKVYESIDWSIIVLLGALLPLGHAIETTDTAGLIVHTLLPTAHETPLWMILGALMIITMTLSDFMNNTATALVMAPIAVGIANTFYLSVDPFLMTVAVASSCSFLTPIGHQNNMLVMGPGGYKFYDYIRLGLPLEILILCAGVPLILHFWPA